MKAAKISNIVEIAKQCDTIDQFASLLNVSLATAYRRLKAAGTTFDALHGNAKRPHIPAKDGERFGRWTVVVAHGSWVSVKCDCGSQSKVRLHTLRNGDSKSCGCLNRDKIINRSTKHGMCGTREYRTWMGMRARCHNPNASNFQWYGAQGVSVCKKWRDSFASFFADMGPCPSANHSLDRIDPFGDYSPENCRWVTHKEQMNNQRKHHASGQ